MERFTNNKRFPFYSEAAAFLHPQEIPEHGT